MATSTEVTIRNCFVAIIKDGNEVLSSYWYETSDLQAAADYTTDITRHMIVKVPSKNQPMLKAYAVANLNEVTANSLLACTTLNDIKDVELTEQPNLLVKLGEQAIDSYKTTSTFGTSGYSPFTFPLLVSTTLKEANSNAECRGCFRADAEH